MYFRYVAMGCYRAATTWASGEADVDTICRSGFQTKHRPSSAAGGLGPALPWRCSLDLLKDPPTETPWLLEGLLPVESVVLFSGREGTMKTWVALEWAQAIAEGALWQGRHCEAGAVLWLDAEMPENLFKERLRAVGGSQNLYTGRWQDEGFPEQLNDHHLIEAAQTHRLIVVDSLKRFMGRYKENESDDMAKVTAMLRKLTQHGATVLAIHHAAKDPQRSGYRGSTELGAGVDITLTVERKTGPEERLLIRSDKTRYDQTVSLNLLVGRGSNQPVFEDHAAAAHCAAQQAYADDLDRLATVIGDLESRLQRRPNQSEVITEAKARGLASRNTLLGWLQKGEGTCWHSELDDRSRVYSRLGDVSTCPPPRGAEEVDNRSVFQDLGPDLSTNPQGIGNGQVDNRSGAPAQA